MATYVARMRINFEREESLRARMLDAADDYSSSATRAKNALHRAIHLVPADDLLDENGQIDANSEDAAELRAAIDEARPVVDKARAHFTRVQLLYGTNTASGKAALTLISQLSRVLVILDGFEVDYAESVFDEEVREAHHAFTREARRALLSPSLRDPEDVLSPREEALAEARAEWEADQLGAAPGENEQ